MLISARHSITTRKGTIATACFFVLFIGLISCADKKKAEPGIPLELAIERQQSISNLRYDLYFDIPEWSTEDINAKVTATFDLALNAPLLQLDFNAPAGNVKSILVNQKAISIVHQNEHVVIEKKSLAEGPNTIEIEFIAGNAALNRNRDYLYTLFVPSRASTCFPVFDQPDLKAIYRLELRIPKGWQAVSNGRLVSLDSSGSKNQLRFSETKPTSTYQLAFAAGKFYKATDPVSGMNMYYRETDTAKVARNVARIFELHRESLVWLKDYTGIDYPYEKFDFALIPAFQFGGMEHPGNIFYRENSLFLDPSPSVLEEMRRASLIAHETAHMWFGNLVTMKWFNDVWLKEVFANFMAAKMVDPSFPQINHELRFLMAHYPAAYEIDRSAGSHPIQQPLDNLRNAGSIYGAIIYQKAPIMMRNLESLMGAEAFQRGLRDYLNAYSYSNATWDELITSLKKQTDQDLEVWNQAWIKTKGMPEIVYSTSAGNKMNIEVVNDSLHIIWPQFFLFQTGDPVKENATEIKISGDGPFVLDTPAPAIIPNFRGRGYGYFRADQASIDHMLISVGVLNDPEARAGIWMNIWEYLLHGELDPSFAMQKMTAAVDTEKDPLVLEYVIDKIGRIFWQFITPAQRTLLSKDLDNRLFERLVSEKDISIKRTLFNGYLNVALSPEGVSNLMKFWKNEITAGLDLSERDHTQLAYELALRHVDGYEALLQEQIKSITNPDRKAEMEFIIPALSSEESVRDDFFESLKEKENRTHEPWVLQAQRLLHHPLWADRSIKYVRPSLNLLEEMQRTGDIFFPKGWLDATLQEYQTEEVAAAVREYLKENKGLRPDLKNKLLQSADMLFRAEQILKKNGAANK